MEKHIQKRTYHTDMVNGINGYAVKDNVSEGNKADNQKAPLLFSAVYKVVGKEG